MLSPLYITTAILAIGASDVIEAGGRVGTASNQYLLGALVVCLIIVVLHRERQQNKQHDQQITANRIATDKAEIAISTAQKKADDMVHAFGLERDNLYQRMEKANAEMNEERRQRWTMMIDVIRENTLAFRGCREAIDSLKTYLDQKIRT